MSVPFLKYDTKSINQDVPIESVIATYAGIHLSNSRGKNIHCPSPNHNDKKPSAHIYKDKNICKCFSCNASFNAIGLAKEYFPDLSFPDLCQKVLEDFGLNPYQYSNLAEVEAATTARKENKFYDTFPLNYEELDFIGLHGASQKESEITYAVNALDYFNHFFGEVPRCAYDEVYDENGRVLTMHVTAGEAADMGIIDSNEQHEYRQNPSFIDLWRDSKKDTEQMMLNKCYDKIDELREQILDYQSSVDDFKSKYSSDETRGIEKLRSAYINAVMQGQTIKLRPEQEQKINDFCKFESNKNILALLKEDVKQANKIALKISDHQKERNKALKEHRCYER